MNCLNKEEFQKYIDQEVSAEELNAFNNHISNCSACLTLFSTHREELNKLMDLLSKVELTESEIAIPEFKGYKKSRYRVFKYISIAASMLILFGVTWRYQKEAEKRQAAINANLELEQLMYNSDSNKAWNKKEPIISITNKDGEIIYSTFED